jgi:chitin synthase
MFNISQSKSPSSSVDFFALAKQLPGQDITTLFTRDAADFSRCRGISYRIAQDPPCNTAASCPLGLLNNTATFKNAQLVNISRPVGYDWNQVSNLNNYIVLDGQVLNLNPYFQLHPNPIPGDEVDSALRALFATPDTSGRDGTRLFVNRPDLRNAMPCMIQRYRAGSIDKITPGCFVSQLILYAGLIVVMSLVLVRFTMACVFNWFLSRRLAGNPDDSSFNRTAISPAVLPEGANISIDNRNGTAPWAGPDGTKKLAKPPKSMRSFHSSSSTTLTNPMAMDSAAPIMSLAQIGAELFVVCLVTCYSEGEESLRTTLDSISSTSYSDHRKLLFVVADGMITGAGEKRSTPDICVGLLDADPRFGNPTPMSYVAVGSGSKQENRAMVYAGHYSMHRFYSFMSSRWN